MIRIRNESEQILDFFKGGAAAAANDVAGNVSPISGRIVAIYAVFGKRGTDGTGAPTQNVQVDLKKNGTSLFASAATSLIWAHALQTGGAVSSEASAYGPFSPTDPPVIAKGDYLQLDILQILNGTAPVQPQDLSVFVVVQRGTNDAPAKALYGQISTLD